MARSGKFCKVGKQHGNWCNKFFDKYLEEFPDEINTWHGEHLKETYCVFHMTLDENKSKFLTNKVLHKETKQWVNERELVSVEDFSIILEEKIKSDLDEGKEIDFRGTIFIGQFALNDYIKDKAVELPMNFSNCKFIDNVGLLKKEFNESVRFCGSRFEKKVGFIGSTFKSLIDFSGCYFNDEVFFGKEHRSEENGRVTEFCGKSSFYRARFNEAVDFTGAIFHFYESSIYQFTGSEFVEIDFSEAVFKKTCNFTDVSFAKEVSFNKTIFEGKPLFLGVKFSRHVSFRGAYFKSFAEFGYFGFKDGANWCVFISGADFMWARFDDESIFDNVKFPKNTDVDFSQVNIGKEIVFDDVSIQKTKFLNTDVSKINFKNCEWAGEKGDEKLYDDVCIVLDENNADNTIKVIKKVEDLYRQLKERGVREQYWERVSNWHFREKETVKKKLKFIVKYYHTLKVVKEKHSGEEFIGEKKVALKKAAICLYSFLSGYNEKPLIAIRTLLLLLVFSMGVYGFFGYGFDNIDCLPLECIGWYKLVIIKAFGLLPFVSIDSEVIKSFLVFESVDLNYFEKEFSKSFWEQLFSVIMQAFVYIQVALIGMSIRNKLRR